VSLSLSVREFGTPHVGFRFVLCKKGMSSLKPETFFRPRIASLLRAAKLTGSAVEELAAKMGVALLSRHCGLPVQGGRSKGGGRLS
jgi:hypothetical protein